MSQEWVLRDLAEQLPGRVKAARNGGLDCVRLTIAEAHAVRGLLPAAIARLEQDAVDERRSR